MPKFLIFFFLFSVLCHSQESPKSIISDKKKDFFIDESISASENEQEIKQYNSPSLSQESPDKLNESMRDTTSSIVIEDLPNNYNSWNGILSSDNNGLGWMMWGNTSYDLSRNLISSINPSNYSPTLNKLLKNLLLSRAKGPNYEGKNLIDNMSNKTLDLVFPFLGKKIAYLTYTGFDQDINKLINGIPQDLKTEDFKYKNFQIRFDNFDIPYTCNNVSKMLSNKDNIIFYRKILIVCKIIQKKEEEAMLAMDLLENDLLDQDIFIDIIRNFLENNVIKNSASTEYSTKESNLLKILSYSDYENAKKKFENMPRIFHKTIYDLKLFSRELQVESLEFLVNQDIYPLYKLADEYNSLIKAEELVSYEKEINNKEILNSVKARAALFKLINTDISEVARAKKLMLLWDFASEINIFKAIAEVTKKSTLSLSPNETLNWFNMSAFKALLLSNEIEEAKKWLFYGTSEIEERASIDINFCKLLIMLYLYEGKFKDYNNDLDILYLLNVLNNDLNTDEKMFLKLITTITALGDDVPSEMWEIFLPPQILGNEKPNFLKNNINNYFLLEHASSKKNIAEAALLSFILLQKEQGIYKNMFDFYKGLNGLNNLNLKLYARDYAIEENYEFLSR